MTNDITRPSVSRIYDYMLGGHHNFEVDRAAIEQILKIVPSYPKWARINRWFLQFMAERWNSNGYEHILDFGTGLPTQGHFHDLAPSAKVVYTDNDPVTVAYAHEILGKNPQVIFLHADARNLEGTLEAAERHFGGQRRVAIGFIGISYFIEEASLATIMQELHAWAAPGSEMAISFVNGDLTSPHLQEIMATYKRMAAELFIRSLDDMKRICAPWHVQECKALETWSGSDTLITEADRENSDLEPFGLVLEHKG